MQTDYTGASILPRPAAGCKPEYNATRPRLRMPEYGRLVQQMVEEAVNIPTKPERQRYAERIVSVMLGLNPKMRNVEDYRHKVWDYLARLSDYRLDIDYPYEIVRHDEEESAPVRLSYPKGFIRFRHYGRLIERATVTLKEMSPGPERDAYMRLVANRMKRNLADWKGDGVADSKVAHDIAFYTEGAVEPNFEGKGEALMKIGDNKFRTRKNKNGQAF